MAGLRSSMGSPYLPTIGIRADGVRSKLECSRWRRNSNRWSLTEASRWGRQQKKVQIYSKVMIDDIWSIQGGVVKVQWCSDLNTVDTTTIIGPSPMADGKTSSMSSRRHCTRHAMETRCGSKSKEKHRRVMKMINGRDWLEGRSCNRSWIQTIKVLNPIFFNILDAMVGADQGDSNVWCRYSIDR